MPRKMPDDLTVAPFASRILKGTSRTWINGSFVTVRKHVRSDDVTDRKGSIIGCDQTRPRWILINFSDGSIDWFHVDMLRPY